MKIIWSPIAIEKVSQFAAVIALDKPMVATKWVDDMFDSVKRLAEFPLSGKMVPEIGRKDIREVMNGNYRVIYKVLGGQIQVLTVRHKRQQFSEKDLSS